MTTTKTTAEILADHLDCSPDELRPAKYDHYGLEVFELGSHEYAIGDDAAADSAAKEYIVGSVWAFNASFLAGETDLPQEVFEAMQVKCEGANEPILMLIEKTCGLASFVQSAISADGRGHFLSSYDGEENEQDGLFIYRIN